MHSERRHFLQNAVAFLGGLVATYISSRKTFDLSDDGDLRAYKVRYSCKVPDPSEIHAFQDERKDFEQLEKIIETNEIFLADGRLLSTSHEQNADELVWHYLFKDKKSYKTWNRIIYQSGYFSKSKVPSKYQIEVVENYV